MSAVSPDALAAYGWSDRAAVDDWVAVDGQRVAAVVPRWSCLERRGPDTGRAQVLAANVDLVLVTVPGDRPNSVTSVGPQPIPLCLPAPLEAQAERSAVRITETLVSSPAVAIQPGIERSDHH
jgi:hypothetical protein